MTYEEQQNYVTKLFSSSDYDMEPMVRTAKSLKSIKEQRDVVLRTIMRVVPKELAYYRAPGSKEKIYIFNGKYYEKIPYDGVKYGLDEFLYKLGIPAAARDDKSLYAYMQRVCDIIKRHELRPRLSLMCFENCVVDMNDLKKMEHSRDHDVVKMYPFRYDRREIFNCRLWNRFLGESYLPGNDNEGVLPEKDKRRVLQMFLGACLADRTANTFEYFAILQGTGANGKSVIQRVLAGMFGEDEMLNIRLSQFTRGGDEGLRAIGSMQGKRLIHCTESTKSDFKDMSTIKAISSGEPMAGRSIGEDIKMMMRPPLLICNSNYRWKMDDFISKNDPLDESVKRRAIIINFDKTIPVEKRDAQLAQKLSEEYAGIFAWLVKGLVDLRNNDYHLPDVVPGGIEDAIKACARPVYAPNGNLIDGTVAAFMKSKQCHPTKSDTIDRYKIMRQSTDLYNVYMDFCEANGLPVAPQRKFGLDMSNLGYEKVRVNGSQYVLYIDDMTIASNFEDEVKLLAPELPSIFEGDEISNEDFANG